MNGAQASVVGKRNELVDHIHFIVWAYKEKQLTPDGSRYVDYVEMDIIATEARLAIERAERLVPKALIGGESSTSGYKVMRVYEHVEGQCNKGH